MIAGDISEPARRFLERLQGWFSDTFTTTDARRREETSRAGAYAWIAELRERGAIERVKENSGSKAAVYRVRDQDAAAAGSSWSLPSAEEVAARG
jgi:hypothetical protein